MTTLLGPGEPDVTTVLIPEARARQRRRRRWVAAVVIALLAGSAIYAVVNRGGPGSAPKPPPPPRTTQRPVVEQLREPSAASETYPAVDLAFPNRSTGWLLGSNESANRPRSQILRTNDGGKTWATQWQQPGNALSMSAVSPERAWALIGCTAVAPCRPRLFATVDGGRSWRVRSRLPTTVTQVRFTTPTLGVANANRNCENDSSCSGRVIVTRNGGRSWTTALRSREPVFGAASPNGRLWAVEAVLGNGASGAPFGLRFLAKQPGDGWKALSPVENPGEDLEDLPGPQLSVGLAVADAGPTWVSVITSGCGMHGGCAGPLWHSTDGGRTWRLMPGPSSEACGLDDGTLSAAPDGSAWSGYSRSAAACSPPYGPITRYTDRGTAVQSVWQLNSPARIDALSSSVAYALTDNGALVRSTDAGRQWTQLLPMALPTGGFAPVSSQVAFGAGDSADAGAVLATDNGGATWRVVAALPGIISQLDFITARHGLAVTWALSSGRHPKPSVLWQTADAGRHWRKLAEVPVVPQDSGDTGVYGMWLSHDGHGLIVDATGNLPWLGQASGATRLFASTTADGGRTWTPMRRLPSDAHHYFGAVSFIWTGTAWAGWLVHQDTRGDQIGTLTVGSGAPLHPLKSPFVTSLQLTGSQTGVAWGEQTQKDSRNVFQLWETTDGGLHWQEFVNTLNVSTVAFTSPSDGWLLDTRGVIWHTANTGRTWTPAG